MPSRRVSPRHGLAVLAIFFAALALRLALFFGVPDPNYTSPMEMERVAQSFAATGELANPYATPTGPTAHVLPLYPVLLGTIYRLWGTGASGRIAQGVWSCTLSALRCALLYLLGLTVGLSRRVSLLAGILSCFYISAYSTEIGGGWEAPLSALFLMGLTVFSLRLAGLKELRFSNAVAYGCALGISALLSATLLAAGLGFLAAGAWVFRRSFARYLAWSGVVIVMVVLCLVPWAARNQQRLGHRIWLRSNFGLELYQAYHDGAGVGALDINSSVGPAWNPAESNRVRELGEFNYHQRLRETARQWINAHPKTAAHLFLGHLIYYWFPPATSWTVRLGRSLPVVFGAWGVILLVSRRVPIGYAIAIIWVVFPPIYYVVYWSSRYRYPMEWTLLLGTAVALSALWSRYRGEPDAWLALARPAEQ